MTNTFKLAFQLSSVVLLGVAGLGAAGCSVSASASVGVPETGCVTDSTVNCPTAGTAGYVCAADSFPTDSDPTLICSDGVADGTGFDYCCGSQSASYGCNSDSSLVCAGGAAGETCTGGALPDSSSQICSDPQVNADGSDSYCCAAFSGTTCQADSTVQGCAYPSYGFSCATGDNPMTTDATLTCSTPVTSGAQDLFCCTDGSGTVAGCQSDSTVTCTTSGSSGFSCPAGSAPPNTDGTCSDPVTDATTGNDDYCCFTGETFTGCTVDTTLTCTTPGSYGFDCTAGSPDPTADDPTLNCSSPTTLSSGDDGYCCQ